ncbi:hypothetical protein [Desulfosporosinus sp. Sb-LF]|uniref:hypothetical protein n=1 Tax=Desulfosporosinus sp. Sb-LF TaxID=2560027 RepID=UPI00107F9EAE|nr:hypothetical protein [Desulfosporosinus sp. Sb-LF]TGE34254.1 hypothetical protein E4K68_00670 [Desulfosporosinus sp. Sb-LF]
MINKNQSPDQNAKEAVLNHCRTLEINPWFIAKINNPPDLHFLYASFYLEGINIYQFSSGQVTLSQSYDWEDFTEATADFFALNTKLVLDGEHNRTTILMMDSGKKLLPHLQSYTSINVTVIDRPWWRKIIGFRSNTKWKMVIATAIYLVLASKVVGAYNTSNVLTSSATNTSSYTQSTPVTAPATVDTEYTLVKKEYLSKGTKLFIEDLDTPKLVLAGSVLGVNPNYVDTNGNKYFGISFEESDTKNKYWKDVNQMIKANMWYVKTSEIKQGEAQQSIEKETPKGYEWKLARGYLSIGVKLYYGSGENKMYVGQILDMEEKHYDPNIGKTFRAVKLKMYGGSVEWKDRTAILTGDWYIRSDDTALPK